MLNGSKNLIEYIFGKRQELLDLSQLLTPISEVHRLYLSFMIQRIGSLFKRYTTTLRCVKNNAFENKHLRL